ncbi:preprotein translocase subunit SecE [Olsenella urininfantis]|uniref:preprotein translocase subunit SecE n=1 Tax=Olsenella urininfantis TaxID=1871033 RepID=UPI000986BA94|nr:preprotein translocase subunit SecE [Olsenella urininfantis]
MAKKERQKRSARQARAQERAERETQLTSSEEGKEKAALVSSQPTKKAARRPGRLRSYLSAVRSEMHRVVWPDKAELKNYSVAVIVALVVVGLAVWLVDTGFVALLVGFTGLRG